MHLCENNVWCFKIQSTTELVMDERIRNPKTGVNHLLNAILQHSLFMLDGSRKREKAGQKLKKRKLSQVNRREKFYGYSVRYLISAILYIATWDFKLWIWCTNRTTRNDKTIKYKNHYHANFWHKLMYIGSSGRSGYSKRRHETIKLKQGQWR